MKEFVKKVASICESDCFLVLKEKSMALINKHPELFCLGLLAISCLIFLFFGLDFYPLLDVDETRYAVMSRDLIGSFSWNFLNLNAVPFLEKPPLYFWIVAKSIEFFGYFSEFAVRFPIALLASFITFFTYYVGKKVISRKFGAISALILLSSLFFLMLSHIAILDMVLTVFITSAIYCAFLTHFVSDKFKKYVWWFFYMFAAFGFLAKGILAIGIPAVVIFAYNFMTKTVKEIFKPVNMIPGLVIFLLISLPWHLYMYGAFGFTFIKEYFLVHHFARFVDSANIGRERPFWYFVPVFFVGFLPWSLTFVALLIDGSKKLVARFKASQASIMGKFSDVVRVDNNEEKMLLFATLYFLITFFLFSASSTKLPTYILPVFPAAALLTGYLWWRADEKNEFRKAIEVSTNTLATIFICAATVTSFVFFVLPYDIQSKIQGFKSATIYALIALGVLLLMRLKAKKALSVFFAYILTMVFIVCLAVSNIFNLIYNSGENEIVNYSAYANGTKSQLVTFDFAVKPSVMMKYHGKITFVTDPDFKKLDELLSFSYGPTFVIVKNSNMSDIVYADKIKARLELISIGARYSLYVKDIYNEFNNLDNVPEDSYLEFGYEPSTSNKSLTASPNDYKKLPAEPIFPYLKK